MTESQSALSQCHNRMCMWQLSFDEKENPGQMACANKMTCIRAISLSIVIFRPRTLPAWPCSAGF